MGYPDFSWFGQANAVSALKRGGGEYLSEVMEGSMDLMYLISLFHKLYSIFFYIRL